MVSRPTLTAVKASISTPVRPKVSTVTVSVMPQWTASGSNSAPTRVSARGCASGIRSAVRFAAWIAARRATPSTSPFFAVPSWIRRRVAACMRMLPRARAMRRVSALSPTSTIGAWPRASKWLSFLALPKELCFIAEYHIIMRISSLLALFLAFLPPALAEGLPDLGDARQVELSPQMERRIGESIMRDMRLHEPDFVDDAEATAYLNALGNRLVANSEDVRQDFEFFLVKDPTLNAFALPGGYIGVHTGLIVAAQSESELAAVLAHEIAHVTQRHMARMASKEGQLSAAMLAAMVLAILARNSQAGSAAAAIGQASAITAQIGYTRDFEREADRLGFLTLEKSGFD